MANDPHLFPAEFETLKTSLEWKTAIKTAFGHEYRDQLYPFPRIKFEATVVASADKTAALLNILQRNKKDWILLPDWRYSQITGEVTSSGGTVTVENPLGFPFFVGDTVVFRSKDEGYTTHTITGVNPTTITVGKSTGNGSQDWFMPAVKCAITTDATSTLLGNDQVLLAFSCIAQDYVDMSSALSTIQAALPTLSGYPVLTDRDTFFSGTKYANRTAHTVQNGDGGAISVSQTNKHYRKGFVATKVIANSKQLFSTEAYLHLFSGKGNAFWGCSWTPDYIPVVDNPAGAQTIRCRNALGLNTTAYRVSGLAIDYTSGEKSFHEVSLMLVSEEFTIFAIEPPIPFDVTFSSVKTISSMCLQRLDTDVVTLDIQTGISTKFSVPTIEVFR